MGDVILRFGCELTYEPGQGIEVRLKHGGSLSRDVIQHMAQAGKELSLGLQHLAGLRAEPAPEKVRTKIEIEETRSGEDCI